MCHRMFYLVIRYRSVLFLASCFVGVVARVAQVDVEVSNEGFGVPDARHSKVRMVTAKAFWNESKKRQRVYFGTGGVG
jgi:hypothetical protein